MVWLATLFYLTTGVPWLIAGLAYMLFGREPRRLWARRLLPPLALLSGFLVSLLFEVVALLHSRTAGEAMPGWLTSAFAWIVSWGPPVLAILAWVYTGPRKERKPSDESAAMR